MVSFTQKEIIAAKLTDEQIKAIRECKIKNRIDKEEHVLKSYQSIQDVTLGVALACIVITGFVLVTIHSIHIVFASLLMTLGCIAIYSLRGMLTTNQKERLEGLSLWKP